MNDAVKMPFPVYAADPLTQRVLGQAAKAYDLALIFVAADADPEITLSGPVRLGAVLQKIRRYDRDGLKATRPVILGSFVFDPEESVLIKAEGDETVVLTEKEAAILNCLIAAHGAFITRRDLLTTVWGYVDGVETHTLETHIYRLRQKLEVDPGSPEILLTEEQGYSLRF